MIGRNSGSFSAFQSSVEDAWEADDEEFLSLISKTVAERTAKEVLKRHSDESQSVLYANSRGPVFHKPFDLSSGNSYASISLLSYDRRINALEKKRKQYTDLNLQFFNLRNSHDGSEILRQVQKDLVRMQLLQNRQDIFGLFERVLFNWSIRHPGSGYVQGINDLLTPFVVVFLSEHTKTEMTSTGELKLSTPMTEEQLQKVEADVFWCVSRLLDTIQDNYTFAQPGIQNNINKLSSLIERLDNELHRHLMNHRVEYLQFSFRWMNNLLIRELPLRCIIRLWDTYMAEADGFSQFHVYVCAAFLLRFKDGLLRQNDFHSLLVYLQALPTYRWTNDDIEMILAQAFQYKSLFSQAPKHLDYQKREPQ